MVNYVGTPVHCVYESIPFMIIQNPYKKYTAGRAPYVAQHVNYIHTTLDVLNNDKPSTA